MKMQILLLFSLVITLKAENASTVADGQANNSTNWNQLKEIRDGESCTEGQVYRKACNTCRCGANNTLACTKKGCLTDDEIQKFMRMRKNKKSTKTGSKTLPDLPEGVPCIPGVIYKKDCNRCFCSNKGQASCTFIGCSEKKKGKGALSKTITQPQDVRDTFKHYELMKMKSLPHTAAKCTPGVSYKVECNPCICLHNGNMICEKKLCLNYEDTHQRLSLKYTGGQCSTKHITPANCVSCKCVDNKMKCQPIPNCRPKTLLGKGLSSINTTLDISQGHCEPNMVYNSDCNKCYCQDDKALRCTQKMCVNYSTAKLLKKQLLHLERSGL